METGRTQAPALVVGVGASAGGVEALRALFAHVPPDSGCAFVVILHLSPEHESSLAAIIQAVTALPVTPVAERVRVLADHVYVVPAGRRLTMADGEVRVEPNTLPEGRRAPVDLLFRTLAETHDSRAVCVILSGSGADGSTGLKRVKENGGAVFVQAPGEAAFPEMPRSAIATGLVDGALPAAALPARIAAYRRSLGAVAIAPDPESRPEEQQQALREVFAQLRAQTGHDFASYKRPTLLRRIERRIVVRGLPDLPAYAALLGEHPEEVQALLKDMLISVTSFFRDREAFAALERDVLPRLFAGQSGGHVRAWAVGCATGEEAYSLAMLCAEQASDAPDAPAFQIFATDIDEAAIAHARGGLYTASDVADVSPERLRRFFAREGDRYRVRRELRATVLFAAHNILKDPPFSHIGLAACRNLLIYLNRAAQERVLETLHFALEPDGALMLGGAESAEGAAELFAPLRREHHIYQRRSPGRRAPPIPEVEPPQWPRPRPGPPAEAPAAREPRGIGETHRWLLELYAPPSLLVDQSFDVVHMSERAGRYLQLSGGEPTTSLLRLARPELRTVLRAALHQAVRTRADVSAGPLAVRVDEHVEQITLRVRPAPGPDGPGLALVLFEPAGPPAADAAPARPADDSRARQLEEEVARLTLLLRTSRERHEAQAAALRATGEEQQALVEELRSTTEELETSKEELQSANEELRSVNQELEVKVEEALQASADLQRLVNASDVGTVFLDRELRVTRFTPAARALFELTPASHGRPLSELAHRLRGVDVTAEAAQVLATLAPREREVGAADGRVFVLRAAPYRVGDDRIGGVVLTFFDITGRARAEEALREGEARFRTLADAVPQLIWTNDVDGRAIYFNRRWFAYSGLSLAESIGPGWQRIVHPEDAPASVARWRRALAAGEVFESEYRLRRADGVYRWHLGRNVPQLDAAGRLVGWFGSATDIEELKQADAALRESEERFRLLVEGARDYAMFLMDPGRRITYWSAGAERVFGWAEEEVLGQPGAIIFTPEDRARGAVEREVATALASGSALDRRWHVHRGGGAIFLDGALIRLDDERGGLRGFVKIARDATAQRRIEEELERANTELERRVEERTADLVESNQARQDLLRQLVTAQEEERLRVARDLHDQLGQLITGLQLGLKGLERRAEGTALAEAILPLEALALELAKESHRLAVGLRPTSLDDVGLVPALERLVSDWGVHAEVPVAFERIGAAEPRLPRQVELALYRVVQEALTNVRRHAAATRVGVIVERRADHVVVVVEDDGRGFDADSPPEGGRPRLGLRGMRERVEQLAGTLEVESSPGVGTTVLARVPLAPEEPPA